MSDSAPLIMNLGAEVTPAVTSAAPLGSLEPANGNGFAGVLNSMMQGIPTEGVENSLTAEQLLANQLLLAKLQSPESVLQQDQDSLANMLLQGGKPLPMPTEETEVSWQGLFGHYDSTDAESPYLVAMEGDNEGYSISELTPDGIIQHTGQEGENPDQPEAGPDPGQMAALLQERIEQARMQESLRGAAHSSKEIRLDALGQGSPTRQKDAGLAMSALAPETLQELIADQQQARSALATNLDAKQSLQQEQHSAESFNQELKGLEAMPKASMPQNQTHSTEMNSLKLDAIQGQAMQDTSANRPQPVTNMLGGAAAYSAVSGVSGTQAPQAAGNVIANLTVPPDNPGWGNVVGDRVQWMVNQKIQEAQIRLNPPELGMLEVRIQIGQDQQTHVSFSSPHSQVRDALENAMPRLREMFGENGLNLGNVDVSHQSMSDQRHAEQGGEGKAFGQGQGKFAVKNIDIGSPHNQVTAQAEGMLDLYA